MKTNLKQILVSDIIEGFEYNELEGRGLFGLDGRLTIQPEYQRNYIYADGKKDVAVVQSLLRNMLSFQPSLQIEKDGKQH